MLHHTLTNRIFSSVSIDVSMVTEEDEEDIDLDDPDYEPEFEMSAVL